MNHLVGSPRTDVIELITLPKVTVALYYIHTVRIPHTQKNSHVRVPARTHTATQHTLNLQTINPSFHSRYQDKKISPLKRYQLTPKTK